MFAHKKARCHHPDVAQSSEQCSSRRGQYYWGLAAVASTVGKFLRARMNPTMADAESNLLVGSGDEITAASRVVALLIFKNGEIVQQHVAGLVHAFAADAE